MARWRRDPRRRKRLAYLLVVGEAILLTLCFYSIFAAYLNYLVGKLGLTLGAAGEYVVIAGTVVCLGWAGLVGAKYLAGRMWARNALIAANAVLVGLGLAWFIKHQITSRSTAGSAAAWVGLLLPMVTLFPLLWPLLRFRPPGFDAQEGAGGAAGP